MHHHRSTLSRAISRKISRRRSLEVWVRESKKAGYHYWARDYSRLARKLDRVISSLVLRALKEGYDD